jgi:hypothetical protein
MFVPAFDKASRGTDVLWLFSDAADTSPPLRVELAQGDTSMLDAPCPATVASFEHVAEQFGDYHARLRPSPEVTRWFWKSIGNGEIGAFDVELPQEYSGEDVSLSFFVGYPASISTPPSLELLVNGVSDAVSTAPVTQAPVAMQASGRLLNPGTNQLGLRVRYEGANVPIQDLLVQKIVARWRQPLGPVLLEKPTARRRGMMTFQMDPRESASLAVQFGETTAGLARHAVLFAPLGTGFHAVQGTDGEVPAF